MVHIRRTILLFMVGSNKHWTRLATHDFWGAIVPSDHVVQIYDDDQNFLSLLEGFVTGGFDANDCVIVIATEEHLHALEDRLRFKGHRVFELKLRDQYIPLNAKDTLDEFMINNWPDEVLFTHFMNREIALGSSRHRKVRVFGELVALLWAHGNVGASVKMEHMWNKMCKDEMLSLFCAYPKRNFDQRVLESILTICGSQSKMIKLPKDSHKEILFKDIRFNENTSQIAG
jgi:hypothetical protein